MNERIRELFKTIRKYKHTYNLMSNPPQVRYNYTIEEQDIEKFAELIVRECASVVKKEMDYDANWCDDKILKHFGVE
jgi:adenine C2-methylase RlmN of 23S rRNA A2503 and tRNA A37